MLPESVAGNPPRSIVTDHYLLDQCNRYSGHAGPGPANNCQFRMILSFILKKKE